MDAKVNLIALKRELSVKLLKVIDLKSRINNVVFVILIESSIATGHYQLVINSDSNIKNVGSCIH